MVFPGNAAFTVWLPVVVGVKLVEQADVPPLPARVQVFDEKVPVPTLEKVTVPVGVSGVPVLVSVTVNVHWMGTLTM